MTVQMETPFSRAGIYFAFALVAFVLLAMYASWAALIVVGYAYVTPIRHNRRMLIAVWVIGSVITAWFLIMAIGLIFPITTLDVGPVHQVN
jgi:hypothetical protein